jgi:hypothetical protein
MRARLDTVLQHPPAVSLWPPPSPAFFRSFLVAARRWSHRHFLPWSPVALPSGFDLPGPAWIRLDRSLPVGFDLTGKACARRPVLALDLGPRPRSRESIPLPSAAWIAPGNRLRSPCLASPASSGPGNRLRCLIRLCPPRPAAGGRPRPRLCPPRPVAGGCPRPIGPARESVPFARPLSAGPAPSAAVCQASTRPGISPASVLLCVRDLD